MKKAMIGVIAVVVAAVVGCTVYEVASKGNNITTAITSSVSNSSNNNLTESSTSESSETASSTASSTEASSVNTKVVLKDTISSKTASSTTKASDSANKETTSSKTESSVTQPSTTKSSTTESSGTKTTSSSNKNTTKDSTSSSSNTTSSNSNVIDGEPVLFNSNSQVSAYYGTWTVGDKIGAATVGEGESSTSPSGETLILTKSLYSFNGTVIEDPNYYIIATSASAYFGSAGWTGDVGASNGVISFIIAVPSNVKVTASTIYKYETQLKIIENNGSLAVMNGAETVYSASL